MMDPPLPTPPQSPSLAVVLLRRQLLSGGALHAQRSAGLASRFPRGRRRSSGGGLGIPLLAKDRIRHQMDS